MAESVGPTRTFGCVLGCFGILLAALCWVTECGAQIQGSAGQETTKPFTATVALREGYDSNPLTQPYSSTQDVVSSTYTSVQPSLGYNYLGLQADAALRYDFTGTYWPSINQSYDIQYSHTFIGRYTFAFNPRFSITIADNFLYSEQPLPQLVTEGLAPVTQVNGFINNLGTIQADYRVSDRLSMVTRWNNTLVNSDSLGTFASGNSSLIDSGSNAQSNYMNNGARQEFRLDFTPETVGLFIFDYQIYDYAEDSGTFRDNQQMSFQIGSEHTFLPELFFRGSAGIQLNDNFGLKDDPDVIGPGGLGSGELEISADPTANITATWNYEEKSFASVGFSVAVQQSNQNNFSDSEAYSFNLNWDHQFTEKFSVIQSFFINLGVFTPELNKEQANAQGVLYQGSGQQTTVQYQCKFAYQFLPYLAAELGWNYTSFGSYFDENNGSNSNYTRNQVYLGVRGTY